MNNLIHDEIKRSVEMTSTLDYSSLKIKEHLKVSAEQPEQYYSTAEEADSGIWRHAMQSQATNILIYYNIILAM